MNTPDSRFTAAELRALGELSPAESALVEWADTIDAALDQTLDPEARARFETELDASAALREAYDEARASRSLTSQIRPEACPPSLSDAIRAAVDSESANPVDFTTSRPLRTPAPRPRQQSLLRVGGMLAAAVALAALLLPGRLVLRNESVPPSSMASSGYSDAEVRAALAEMHTAMAMISGAMDGTANALRSELQSEVGERLRAPLEEGLRRSVRSIPYLNPDSGNDQHSRNLSPPRKNSEVLEMVNALERTTT